MLEYDPNADKIHMMIKNIINNFKNPFQSPVFMAVPPKIQKKTITKNNIISKVGVYIELLCKGTNSKF